MKNACRTFLLEAEAFAASPVLVGLVPSPRGAARQLTLPERAAYQTDLVFKVDGWSVSDDIPLSCDPRWLGINEACRTAWR